MVANYERLYEIDCELNTRLVAGCANCEKSKCGTGEPFDIYLWPGERQYLEPLYKKYADSGKHMTSEFKSGEEDFLTCRWKGGCPKELRPVNCRLAPFSLDTRGGKTDVLNDYLFQQCELGIFDKEFVTQIIRLIIAMGEEGLLGEYKCQCT